MYKPCNIRKMVTPAVHQKSTTQNIYGVDKKIWADAPAPNLRGEYKQKTSQEVTANGVIVVKEQITFSTWFKADLKAGDRLIIGGETYDITAAPDNVEGRKRYTVCYLSRIGGGA